MKQFKTLVVAALIFIGATSMVSAQAKVAHIDTQKLISEMPAMKSAQNELKKLQQTYESQIRTAYNEFEAKRKQYAAEANTKTDEENQKRSVEIQGMRDNILKYEQNAQQELAKKQENLLKPIMDQARTAIQKVARAKGYQYVIDSTTGSGLILADGPDLLGPVKKELGM